MGCSWDNRITLGFFRVFLDVGMLDGITQRMVGLPSRGRLSGAWDSGMQKGISSRSWWGYTQLDHTWTDLHQSAPYLDPNIWVFAVSKLRVPQQNTATWDPSRSWHHCSFCFEAICPARPIGKPVKMAGEGTKFQSIHLQSSSPKLVKVIQRILISKKNIKL